MSAVLQPAAAVKPSGALPQTGARNVAIDTYRGLVMLLMMAEVLELAHVSAAFPGNPFWSFLAWNQTHVAWSGCSLHDTIQPGFSFLVGVALPYSIASRIAKGGTFGRMLGHAMWRSLLLMSLGIFLRSQHTSITYFTFEDTLTQIGLGYTFLFLLGFASRRVRWAALGAVLFGYWLAWALYPSPDWAAHWAKNHNLGVAFDQWFLNLFPRTSPFVTNDGGYLTLSFIPTLGTMILGLIAGDWLRSAAPRIPFRKFFTAAAICIAAGPAAALHRHLPHREAHLDARLDAVQRRPVLPLSVDFLLADGGEGLSSLGLPAHRDRHELDRRLRDGGDHARLDHRHFPHPPGRAFLRASWARGCSR